MFARFLAIVVALNVSQLSPATNYSSEVDRYELITVDIPGARNAYFSDLNDVGEGVGTSFTMDGREQTFRWTTSGAQILTTTSGRTEYMLPHINNKGAISITGWISPRDRAFRWDQRDGLLDLGTFGWSSYPTAINNRGDVVGYSKTEPGFSHAFIWTEAGDIKDLGTLGGWQSQATGINDHGRVVGISMVATGNTHGFVWSAETGMKDLGVVPGYQYSFAHGVNKRGDIYGRVENSATPSPGLFFWTDVSGFTRLGPLGIYWSTATGLNDRGEIIGDTKDTPFDNSAFIWTTESEVKRLPTLGGAYTQQRRSLIPSVSPSAVREPRRSRSSAAPVDTTSPSISSAARPPREQGSGLRVSCESGDLAVCRQLQRVPKGAGSARNDRGEAGQRVRPGSRMLGFLNGDPPFLFRAHHPALL